MRLNNRYTIILTPITQPTCGLELKVNATDATNKKRSAKLVELIKKILDVGKMLMKKNKVTFVKFILIYLATSTFICVISAWWMCEGGNNLLLKNYGITEYAMGEEERYQNVKPENIKRAKEIYESMFGIGWPLRAIMTYIFYLPYLIFGYLIYYFIQKKTQKHDSTKKSKV